VEYGCTVEDELKLLRTAQYMMYGVYPGLINNIDTKAKYLHVKIDLRQVFVCLRPPPLLGFCLGWSSNFVGSESGKIQSVNLQQDSTPPTTSQLHTLSVYTVL
jgi:hypothetical protein